MFTFINISAKKSFIWLIVFFLNWNKPKSCDPTNSHSLFSGIVEGDDGHKDTVLPSEGLCDIPDLWPLHL